ncbi:hypothetical protein CNMCM7691_003160 [Aspergillus felis]|uniref:Uncharacterized protein n=1 Tax=Aspergillus felis TaxID=1287682 RepID=A0A8H6R3W0_9EURO|nr:hypothetical protein CNMCM7691_003160 [Aspergillus felis]
MADPPPGGPEPPPTNTQETTASFTDDDLEASNTVGTRRRTQKRDVLAPSDPAGRIATKEVWKLIGTLKDVIRHQTAAITATQNELHEIEHNQNVLQEQNEKLHEEVRALRAQIENTPAVTTSKTWAAVAASSVPREYSSIHETTETTETTAVAGVGTTNTGYLIRFKNMESAEAARNNTEWPQSLGNNTKLVKPWFRVVVHRTPTEEFDLETGAIQAADKITRDNDLVEHSFHIEELAWMKAKDKALGKFALLGIWFDSAEGAEHMLRHGFLVNGHYS